MVISFDVRDVIFDDKWCFFEIICFFKRMRSCFFLDCFLIGCDVDFFEMGIRYSILV